jgi:hypothetical protein
VTPDLLTLPGSPSPAPSPTGPGAGFIAPPVAPGRGLLNAALWATHRPWLAAVAVGLLIAVVAGRNLLQLWRHRYHAAGARLVTVAPPPEVDGHGAGVLWANLAGILTPSRSRRWLYGNPHVVWQYTWTGRQLVIGLWVPGTVPPGSIEAAVRAAWPGAATTTSPATAPVPAGTVAVGGHLTPAKPQWLPLQTEHDNDPLRALLAAGAGLRADEYGCVQILARPASPRRSVRARRAAGRLRDGRPGMAAFNPALPLLWILEAFLPGHRGSPSRTSQPPVRRDPHLERDARASLDKTAQPLWQTGIRYTAAKTSHRAGADPRDRLRGIADRLASSFAVYTAHNQLTHRTRMPHPVQRFRTSVCRTPASRALARDHLVAPATPCATAGQ